MVAKSLSHVFVSGIADGTDATLVRPSNWNADHNLWYGDRSVTTATDTIANNDHLTTIVYNSATAIAVTLPAPTGGNMPLGWQTMLRNIGAGVVTVTGSGGATINVGGVANTSYALNQGDALEVRSRGTAAYVGVYHPTPVAVPAPSSTSPAMDGTAAVGTGTTYARADHVHPSDTSRAPLASPALTGTPTAPTPATADNSTTLATTAYVKAQPGAAAGASQRVLLNTLTAANSATLDDITSITSTYDEYEFELLSLLPASTNAGLKCLFRVSAAFPTANYVSSITGSWALLTAGWGSPGGGGGVEYDTASIWLASTGAILYAPDISAGDGIAGRLRLLSPNSTTVYKKMFGQLMWVGNSAGSLMNVIAAGAYRGSLAAVTGVRFQCVTGNIASGRIRVFGVTNAG